VQATRTLDRSVGGLGVGLTLVRALVEMHGGTVAVHSAGEGKGAEFLVRLPLAAAPVHVTGPARRGRALPRPGARVVVVEDNADSREVLCALIERAGFECRTAASGIAGLELIDEFAPDVVILDLGLPELDGFEVARRVRANPRHVGIQLIALTGYGQAADRAAAIQAGFDQHVVKPVVAERLLELLADVLGPSPVPDDPARPAAGAADALGAAPAD
jgi:two-component system CheB/CheR fusion protein